MDCRARASDFVGTVPNDDHLARELAAVLVAAPAHRIVDDARESPARLRARNGMGRRLVAIAAFAMGIAAVAGCGPLDGRPRAGASNVLHVPASVQRGARTYAIYCADCHGPSGEGNGLFAATFGLVPANLRASAALASFSDAALVDRLVRGTPLAVQPLETHSGESRAVNALAEYLPRLGRADGDVLRAGRVVYQEACAACHGVYGRADSAVAVWLGAPDMIVARARTTDAALARISERGTGLMPPLVGAFDRTELRALVAYIRHLSDGFAVYDTRCAACHGDDGQGLYSADVIPPAIAAPPLQGTYPRARLLSMLRRERGVMPHFTELDERRLRDVVAYLRAVVFEAPTTTPAR